MRKIRTREIIHAVRILTNDGSPITFDLRSENIKMCLHLHLKSLSLVQLFVIPWTIQSMEFSRPEYWSGQPFPSPGDLPYPGIEPRSPTLQVDSLPAEYKGSPK